MHKLQVRISDARRLLVIESEPYVVFTPYGYQAAIDVQDVHSGENGFLVISAQSLAEPLHQLAEVRGKLAGACISLRKESSARTARYLVSIADGGE